MSPRTVQVANSNYRKIKFKDVGGYNLQIYTDQSTRSFMDNVRGHSGHFKHYAFIWKPAFRQRQTNVYPTEDEKYLDTVPPEGLTLQQWLATRESPAQVRISTQEIIKKFVNNRCSEDIGRYLQRNLQISKFLEKSQIESLIRPSTQASNPMALIDDRNNETVTRTHLAGNCRPPKGPMTAHQLFIELSQERLVRENDSIPAERRLIYITDLDPSYALAIAATASTLQAVFLRDFIHKHLVLGAMIGVDIWTLSLKGFSTFCLEFHMPYYAWRRTPDVAEDVRRRGDGSALRRSEESIPLHGSNHNRGSNDDWHDYIYEAQISVMVTGIDDWVWAAYCFADIYFKDEGHPETVEHISNIQSDPHSGGSYSSEPPVWNPREYYLKTLSYRMNQVRQEWTNSIEFLIQQTEPYIHNFTREDTDVGQIGDITQEKGFKRTLRVLRQFNHLLSKTIKAWDTFNNGEIRYFYKPPSDELAEEFWVNYLAAIDKDVTELRDLRSSLEHQTELFENMTNSLVTHAQHAETIITRLQSEFIQALTIITIFYLPPSLASTIFSMQGVLPKSASLLDWGLTLLGLFIVTSILILNLPRITAFGGRVRRWQEQMIDSVKIFVSTKVAARWKSRQIGEREEGIELEEIAGRESTDTEEV